MQRKRPQAAKGGLGQQNPSPPPLPTLSNGNEESFSAQAERANPDLEFSCVGQEYALVPSGDYEVTFVKAVKMYQWNRHKVFLWFRIQSFGEGQGAQLFLPCNLETEGKISTRSKYYRNWVVAAGKKPDRYDRKRMTTRVFQKKLFLARIVTVKKDQKNLPLPPELQYSKIEGLVQRLIG